MIGSEIWLPVVGYEGLYEVSNMGRVRSCPRTVAIKGGGSGNGYGAERPLSGRIMSATSNGCGYLGLKLSISGSVTWKYVHRLVAEAFIGPCPPGMEVAHGDGVRTNCALTNLSYKTRSENNLQKREHGTAQTGARNGNSRAAKAARAAFEAGEDAHAVLRRFTTKQGQSA